MLRFPVIFPVLSAFILGFSGLHAQTIQRCGADEQLAWEMQNNPRRKNEAPININKTKSVP